MFKAWAKITVILVSSSIAFASCDAMEQLVSETLTEFDQEKIIDAEGYWAFSDNPARDIYEGKYPSPKAHEKPWPGKQAFLEKLTTIEATVTNDYDEIDVMTGKIQLEKTLTLQRYYGTAHSRLEKKSLGDSEFFITEKKACQQYAGLAILGNIMLKSLT